eukprot:11193544-Lingulodinium_polyedra.AAC.1
MGLSDIGLICQAEQPGHASWCRVQGEALHGPIVGVTMPTGARVSSRGGGRTASSSECVAERPASLDAA